MYNIIINNKIIKSYLFKIQVVIWLILNGHVSTGRGYYFLDSKINITKE